MEGKQSLKSQNIRKIFNTQNFLNLINGMEHMIDLSLPLSQVCKFLNMSAQQ